MEFRESQALPSPHLIHFLPRDGTHGQPQVDRPERLPFLVLLDQVLVAGVVQREAQLGRPAKHNVGNTRQFPCLYCSLSEVDVGELQRGLAHEVVGPHDVAVKYLDEGILSSSQFSEFELSPLTSIQADQ